MEIVSGFLALLAVIIIVSSIKIVRQSEVRIVERLGRYNRTLTSGVSFIIPFIDSFRKIKWKIYERYGDRIAIRVVFKDIIDLRESVLDFPRQSVITKDNVNVDINAVLYFQIMDPYKAVYEIENIIDSIEKLTQTTLRNIIGELELDETLSSRDTINRRLGKVLDEATDKWGIKINRVELQDVNPPEDIKTAMEKQMRAERNRRAQILEAEGLKSARILEAEGLRESEITKAEGFKQSEILKADGISKAKVRIAEAEAQAVQVISNMVKEQKGDPINYLVAIRYVDTLKDMVSGQNNKVVYLPFEATGILSSIGGIKDLLKDKN